MKTVIESDLSGAEGAEETYVGIGGEWFSVDLTPAEADELRTALGPYLEAGRPASLPGSVSRRVLPKTTVQEREEIRTWARRHGFAVADFGQIPGAVFDAYAEAHGRE